MNFGLDFSFLFNDRRILIYLRFGGFSPKPRQPGRKQFRSVPYVLQSVYRLINFTCVVSFAAVPKYTGFYRSVHFAAEFNRFIIVSKSLPTK